MAKLSKLCYLFMSQWDRSNRNHFSLNDIMRFLPQLDRTFQFILIEISWAKGRTWNIRADAARLELKGCEITQPSTWFSTVVSYCTTIKNTIEVKLIADYVVNSICSATPTEIGSRCSRLRECCRQLRQKWQATAGIKFTKTGTPT